MSEEMQKALVLRLDSRMAVILNCLVGCAGELANKEVASAIELVDAANRLRGEYPKECQALKDSISAILDVVPAEIMAEMGLEAMSPHELRARVERSR